MEFVTASPDGVAVSFSILSTGPYLTNPPTATGIQFVKVVASGSVTLYFMPGFSETMPSAAMLFSVARQQSLMATATSGQFLLNSFKTGLLPYSPYAQVPGDPNYGFIPGRQYTLRWPPPGQGNKGNSCEGDALFPDPSDKASQRGFIDIGWGGNSGGSAYIRQAIISNVQSKPLDKGDPVTFVTGNKGTESDALRERFAEDSDTKSTAYEDYYANYQQGLANGRRLGIVPINDPTDNNKVLGFGLFLLQSDICGDKSVTPCCATYVSNDPLVPGGKGGGAPGAHKLKLFQ